MNAVTGEPEPTVSPEEPGLAGVDEDLTGDSGPNGVDEGSPEDSERPGIDEDPGDPGLAGVDGDSAGDPGLAAERDRLARTLRDTRLQLAMTQARLAALEDSATMELGRTLVRAARRPWSRGVQLPMDLVRMWRDRGALTGPGAATLALASAQLGDLAGGGERFLSALTAPGLGAPGAASARFTPPGLVITGVLSAHACATLAPDAAVHPVLPHDADVVLESEGADLVLIEAAAMLAGSPWAYAGDPAAADRGRRLGRLIASARALGKPVIFIRNVPAHLAPGLDWVAATCDAVSDDGFGVQLARFNPIGLPGYRPCSPVYAGSRDPRETPAVRALLDFLAGSVTLTGDVGWRARPGLYREHAVFVTVSADQAREQLACGARVIMVAGEPAALRDQIDSARADRPLTEGEALPVLREIFTKNATAVRLAALASLAGLPGHLITGRQVAVLARVEDAAEAAALSAGLARQQMAPAEVVVTFPASAGDGAAVGSVTAALGDLAARGVMITVVPSAPIAADPGGASWVPRAARQARSPWVVPWQRDHDYEESYLLDLACARECSQADAVGPAGVTFGYVTSLEPALARREFFGSDGSRAGLRLFSLS
ncbi:MAG: hypothetical protein ACRDOU_09555 [Streptosporangiaceae bacterium]